MSGVRCFAKTLNFTVMIRFKDNKRVNATQLANCKVTTQELKTQPNLSYTTGEMYNMWRKGVPINNEHNADRFFDGTKDCTFDLPLVDRRGVDVADIWQAQQDARAKFRNYKSKDD